jgi:hypothetical protein
MHLIIRFVDFFALYNVRRREYWSLERTWLFYLPVNMNVQNLHYYYYYSRGVRLCPLGTAATVWPIVPAPDDRC